jgi:hypothetical protein
MGVEGRDRAASAGGLHSGPRRHDDFAKAGELEWPVLHRQHEILRSVALWPLREAERPRFLVAHDLDAGVL